MAFLQVMTGDDEGKKVDFEQDEVSIGRSEDNTIQVQDPSASGHHCIIVKDGNRYTLRDLGATNQTRLNDVPTTEARLEPGDIIIVGSCSVMFDGDDVEVDEPMADTGSTVRIAVINKAARSGTGGGSTPSGSSSPFVLRKDRKAMWLIIISALGVLALAALAVFFYRILNA